MKKLAIIMSVLLLVLGCFAPAAFAEEYDRTPYGTYMYWTDDNDRSAIPIREVYTATSKVSGADLGTTDLTDPTDLDTDADGNLYILDAGNSRVLVTDCEMHLLRTVAAPEVNGELLDFTGAKGIYLAKNGDIYIADTDHSRVLIFDNAGNYRSQLEKPDSNIIPSDFNYLPMKVLMDSRGYVFVLSSGSYYGALVYGMNGEFLGFYGANSVKSTVLDVFSKLWQRLTQTAAKRKASVQKLPYQFISMDMDENDFIYTLTGRTDSIYSDGTGHIRRLNPAGNNTYKSAYGKASDSLDFTDDGTAKYDSALPKLANFTKLCTDNDGFVYVLDATFGHIMIYDSVCNSVACFGGGEGSGAQVGTFTRPESVAIYGDRLYVLDSLDFTVTTFTETAYGKLYKQAQQLTLNGDYLGAKPLWEQVLAQDKNNQLAYSGLAQAALFEGDNDAALYYARLGKDQVDYAVAFQQKRDDVLGKLVPYIIVAVVVLIVAAFVLLWWNKRRAKKAKKENAFRFAVSTLFHPFNAFYDLKYKQKGSLIAALVLLVLYYIARVARDMYSGFAFSIFDAAEYNSLITLLGSVGVVLLWTVVNWGVCVLAQGKAHLKEIFMVTCYALIPEILSAVLSLVLTNLLVPEEAAILGIITVCCHILTGVVLCVGIMAVQEYDFFKFLWTGILTVLGMMLVIFVIFMVFILFKELGNFVSSVYKEAVYQ